MRLRQRQATANLPDRCKSDGVDHHYCHPCSIGLRGTLLDDFVTSSVDCSISRSAYASAYREKSVHYSIHESFAYLAKYFMARRSSSRPLIGLRQVSDAVVRGLELANRPRILSKLHSPKLINVHQQQRQIFWGAGLPPVFQLVPPIRDDNSALGGRFLPWEHPRDIPQEAAVVCQERHFGLSFQT